MKKKNRTKNYVLHIRCNDEKIIKSSSYHPYGNLSREERTDDFIEISGIIWGNICRRKTNSKDTSKAIQTMKKKF